METGATTEVTARRKLVRREAPPEIHPGWVGRLKALEASPVLLGGLSREMLEHSEVVQKDPKSARVAFGVGCVHTGGVSLGVPVDWLRMPIGATITQRTLGLEPRALVATVGLDIARNNPTLAMSGAWPPNAELLGIAATHLLLYKRWNEWLKTLTGSHAEAKKVMPRIQYDLDSHLLERECFRAATEARAKIQLGSVPYSSSQDALFDAYLRKLLEQDSNATMIKFGWAIPANYEEVHQLVAVERRLVQGDAGSGTPLESLPGGCESCFDLLSVEAAKQIWGRARIGYAYLPAPGGLDYRQPAVCPYTAKPIPSSRDGGVHHARILFKDGPESVAVQMEAVLKVFKGTVQHQRANLLGSLRSHVELVQMFRLLVPGYFDSQAPFGELAGAEMALQECNLRCQLAIGTKPSDNLLSMRKQAESVVFVLLSDIIKSSWPKIIETFAPTQGEIDNEVSHLRGSLPYLV